MRNRLFVVMLSTLLLSACGGRSAAPPSSAVEPPIADAEGEKLFAIQCAQCHQLDDALVGPPLRGSLAHWDGDKARYKAFIRNSQAVIKSGDAYATTLFERWNKTVMPPNEGLTEAEIDALVSYLNP